MKSAHSPVSFHENDNAWSLQLRLDISGSLTLEAVMDRHEGLDGLYGWNVYFFADMDGWLLRSGRCSGSTGWKTVLLSRMLDCIGEHAVAPLLDAAREEAVCPCGGEVGK